MVFKGAPLDLSFHCFLQGIMGPLKVQENMKVCSEFQCPVLLLIVKVGLAEALHKLHIGLIKCYGHLNQTLVPLGEVTRGHEILSMAKRTLLAKNVRVKASPF